MRETWTFHTAGQLLFGRNAVRQLGEVARRLGARLLRQDLVAVLHAVARAPRSLVATGADARCGVLEEPRDIGAGVGDTPYPTG